MESSYCSSDRELGLCSVVYHQLLWHYNEFASSSFLSIEEYLAAFFSFPGVSLSLSTDQFGLPV